MPSETTGVSKLHKNLEALYCDELHTAAIALTAELGVVMIAAAALRCRVHAWGKLGLLLTVVVYRLLCTVCVALECPCIRFSRRHEQNQREKRSSILSRQAPAAKC